MAINPTPQVKIIESLSTTSNNPNNILYTINGQVEPISGAVGRVYKVSTGELIFTYYNNDQPTFTSKGYLFPMVQITSLTPTTIVDWAQGKTISDWTNNTQYYIEISVIGRSGDASAYSVGELFWCVQPPTASIGTIGEGGIIDSTQCSLTTTVDLQQVVVPNEVVKYRMTLTDITNNEVAQDTDWIYGKGSGSGASYSFDYTFYDLKDSHEYSVQFIAYTQLDSPIEASSNIFVVATGLVIDGAIEVMNNCDEGCLSVEVAIVGTGSSLSAIPNYIIIQRAVVTNGDLNWVSVYEEALPASFSPTPTNPVIITYDDYYVEWGANVRYRAVPIYRQGNLDTQGVGIVAARDIVSQFNKFFIVDSTNQYGFTVGVSYDSLTLNQQIAVHQPLGAVYPIVVRNSNTKYRNGGFSVTITPSDFEETSRMVSRASRYDMVGIRKAVGDFLTNGAPKIIKDWNGNIWLVEITDNINATFDNSIGMGVASISGVWTELGDVYNTDTLKQTGLISVGG